MYIRLGLLGTMGLLLAGCMNQDRLSSLVSTEEQPEIVYAPKAAAVRLKVGKALSSWVLTCLGNLPKTAKTCGIGLKMTDSLGYWLQIYTQNEPATVLTVALIAPVEGASGRRVTIKTDTGLSKALTWMTCTPECRTKIVLTGGEKDLFLAAQQVEVRYHTSQGEGAGFLVSIDDMKRGLSQLAQNN